MWDAATTATGLYITWQIEVARTEHSQRLSHLAIRMMNQSRRLRRLRSESVVRRTKSHCD